MSEESRGKEEPNVNGSNRSSRNFSVNVSKKGKRRNDCDANDEGQVDIGLENDVEQKKVKLVDDVCYSIFFFVF